MSSQEAVHVSALAVTPAAGKGTQDTWRSSGQDGGRLDKTGATPDLARRRGWGQTEKGRGVYEPAF
jgi:hypothetical protein